MKAARLSAPRAALRIVDAPEPDPGAGEALVRVEACGLCRSDLFIQSLGDLPLAPVTLGHEGIGVVEKLGPEATGLAVGDRVGLTYLYSGCGACEACTAGRPELCGRQRNRGFHVDGAFSELALARADCVARVPAEARRRSRGPVVLRRVDGLSRGEDGGARAGRLARGLGRGRAGAVGDPTRQARRLARGGSRPERGEPQARLRVRRGGLVLDPGGDDLRKAFKSIGGAHGAISFVGKAGAVQDAVRAVRRGGAVVLVGLAPETIELGLLDVVLKGLRVEGSFLGRQADLDAVFALAVEGKIRSASEACGLDEIPAALERMREGSLAGRMVAVL